MRRMNSVSKHFKGRCLNNEDFYTLLTQSGKRPLPDLERHLTGCSYCHDRLTGLRDLLLTEPEEIHEAFSQPTPAEIERTLALIARATRQDATRQGPYRSRYRAAALAAALLVPVGLGAITAIHFANKRKAEAFFASGRSFLEQAYGAQSPSGLRLDLPFSPKATWREAPQEDPLDDADKAFHQALAVKEGMREARLGLGYVYLTKGHFSKAREQFQALLDDRGGDYQARLGRGVAFFEEGITLEDSAKWDLELALADFENVLKQNSAGLEALYDKILTLYQTRRHEEALKEIEGYLRRDQDSLWAQRLRGLRGRILDSLASKDK